MRSYFIAFHTISWHAKLFHSFSCHFFKNDTVSCFECATHTQNMAQFFLNVPITFKTWQCAIFWMCYAHSNVIKHVLNVRSNFKIWQSVMFWTCWVYSKCNKVLHFECNLHVQNMTKCLLNALSTFKIWHFVIFWMCVVHSEDTFPCFECAQHIQNMTLCHIWMCVCK